jgi:hypothetical protein
MILTMRAFVTLSIVAIGLGIAAAAAESGCTSAKTFDDAGAPVCMDAGNGMGQGCPCDPAAFKSKSCYEGPTGTLGPGRACKSGTRKCNPDGTQTACDGQLLPTPEVCNGIDDDCNGKIDDIASNEPVILDLSEAGLDPPIEAGAQCFVSGQVGMCAQSCLCSAGRYGCDTMAMKSCLPLVPIDPDSGLSMYMEVCNGLDDDCNGIVDDVMGLGQQCPADPYPDGGMAKGECANGKLQCVSAFQSCPPSPPMPEKCDGKDNDCNGKIDDGACTNNVSGPWCCNFGGNIYQCYSSNFNGQCHQ